MSVNNHFSPYLGPLTEKVRNIIDAYLYTSGSACDPLDDFWGICEEDTIVISDGGEIAIYSPPSGYFRSAGDLHLYESGEVLRCATEYEAYLSTTAAMSDGGAGVIIVDGRSCYVED